MIGLVRLVVGDLEQAVAFYESATGLRVLGRRSHVVQLGADTPLVELAGDPDAPARPPVSTGLFHLALLVPDRAELARSVRRVVDAGWSFTGASDHFVSESVYLRDPEGNGIEIYRDRPREEWQRDGDEIRMGTVALDLDGVMAELPPGDDAGMADGTVIGHVHLQVADLEAAEPFYTGELGLDVTVRGYPGALFLSRGGYHHHVGLNVWSTAGAPAPPRGARGLAWVQLDPPGERLVRDPSGNALLTN